MIRAAGIATYVPEGGSVRSGGVELFLAGAQRRADPRAEFAVHSWADVDGREATDYAATAPENAKYLAYYRQMGLSDAEACANRECADRVVDSHRRERLIKPAMSWPRSSTSSRAKDG